MSHLFRKWIAIMMMVVARVECRRCRRRPALSGDRLRRSGDGDNSACVCFGCRERERARASLFSRLGLLFLNDRALVCVNDCQYVLAVEKQSSLFMTQPAAKRLCGWSES